MATTITLHAVPPSHPCMAVAAALEYKGLEFERVDLPMTERLEQMEEIYGEGNSTVPGALIDGEPVHGSRAILARLEQLQPEPALYPSEQVREAERWGDQELQSLGRCLPWGAMYFRPESMGTFGGGEPLDGPSARPGAITRSRPRACTTTSRDCPRSSRTSSRWRRRA
jgi:glutathione S-transferase